MRKATIDASGNLVYKPEYEHESLNYKTHGTSGAYNGARLNIPDDTTVDRFAREQFAIVQQGFREQVSRFHVQKAELVTKTRKTYADAYEAIATPAKKGFRSVVAMPARVNEKMERERRAIKAELELATLRLAEARLVIEETKLRGKEYGVSMGMRMLWVSLQKLVNGGIFLLT